MAPTRRPADPLDSSSQRWPILASLALLLLFVYHAVFHFILPGETGLQVGDDIRGYYYPSYLSAYSQLAEGSLPLWNPYQLAGLPRPGAIQSGIFYPFHLLYSLLPVGLAMGINTIVHLGIAAISVTIFARKLGMLSVSALFAGMLLAMRGQFQLMIFAPNMLESAVWIAPGAIAILGLARGEWRKSTGLLGLCTGLSLLAGYPQFSIYIAYLWGALLVILLASERAPLRTWWMAGLGLGSGIALGAALASIQLVPAFELSALGNRKLTSLTQEQMYAAARIPTKFWSTLVGAFTRNSSGTAFHFGVVGVALLPAAWFYGRNRVMYCSISALGILVLLFCLGPVTPFFQLYLSLPLLDSFRLPYRLRFVTDFCFVIAAAGGLDAVVRSVSAARVPGTALGGRATWIAIGAAFVAAVLWSTYFFKSNAQAAGSGAALAIAVALGAWLGTRPGRVRIFALAVFLIALVEIWIAPPNKFWVTYAHPEKLQIYDVESPIFEKLRKSRERVFIHSPRKLTIPEKVPSTQRFRGLTDYEPATTRRQAEYFMYLNQGPRGLEARDVPYFGWIHLFGPHSDPAALEKRSGLVDLLAVDYIATAGGSGRRRTIARYLRRTFRWAGADEDLDLVLWRKRERVHRAYAVYRTESAPKDSSELLANLADENFDPLEFSYVEGDVSPLPGTANTRRGHRVKIIIDEPNRVEIRAFLGEEGLIVLSDTFYPGWRATVNDEKTEILPVNHLFRGVRAPKGWNQIVFEYRPRSVAQGAMLSAIGLAIALPMLLWPRRRPIDLSGLPRL